MTHTLTTPSSLLIDFLPIMLPPHSVKLGAPPPPALEKKSAAQIRISLHREQFSARGQVIEWQQAYCGHEDVARFELTDS